MILRKIYTFVIIAASILASSISAYAEKSASAILSDCAAQLKADRCVTAHFAIEGGARPIDGTISMQGSKFNIITPVMSIWFDGKTQWSYMTDSNEVNITEPTVEEIIESNPFQLIKHFNDNYTCRKLKAPAGVDIIELTPKNQKTAPVNSARVTINRSSGWPTKITVSDRNGGTMSIAITSVNTSAAKPASAFVFDKKLNPKAEIVDLR